MYELIDAFFRERSIVGHHIASFNEFICTPDNIENKMQKIVDNVRIGEDDPKGVIRLELDRAGIENIEVWVGRRRDQKTGEIDPKAPPTISVKEPEIKEADGTTTKLTPMHARLRNLTYKAPIYLDCTVVENGVDREPEHVYIGDIPIMVKSKKCNIYKDNIKKEKGELTDEEYEEALIELGEDPLDPGGYFIINGTERVLISMEDLAPNRVMVEYSERYGHRMEIAKVFSQREGYRALTLIEKKLDGIFVVSVPAATGQIPLIILMKALGMERDEDIYKAIVSMDEMVNIVYANIEECQDKELYPPDGIFTTDDAIAYIEKKFAAGQAKEYRTKKVEAILDKSLLPHLGDTKADRFKKAIFLGRIARTILELALGKRGEDDKDHYANKRIKLSGDLMEDLFRVAFTNLCKDLKYQLERSYARKKDLKVQNAIRPDILTQRLFHALATGNWVGGRVGVSQLLDRTCNMSSISHLRRVISPLTRTQPHFEARDLHPTQWGRLCPNETPEGQNCGLVKNCALLVDISKGYDEEELRWLLTNLGMKEIKAEQITGTKIYVNGNLIGQHDRAKELVEELRLRRRQGYLPNEVNIKHDEEMKEIIINCDEGRLRRPLLIVKDGKLFLTKKHLEELKQRKISFDLLTKEGVIEYLDAEEEENAYICVREEELRSEHTHMEVAPMALLGICAGLIPYAEHNSSPRNTMGAGMAKQALGISFANYRIRPDTRAHMLHYPQTPLVKTKVMDFVNFDRRPAGQNFVVAILSYEGYNMEDALVFNRASIDRGLGRSHFLRTYKAEERRYPGGEEDRFEIPSPDVRGVRADVTYNALSEDGIITPEVFVKGGEVLIGKTSPPRFLEEHADFLTPQKRRETSITVRHGEEGWVDNVILTESENGSKMVKVYIRDERIVELGDKFASRHGQKGVVGIIAQPEDLPFTCDGIVPDLIINPHAIPSRMTIAHVLEAIGGKVGSIDARTIDGTVFSNESERDLRKALTKCGFKENGKEIMYDGITGKMIEADIFIGVIYYQKLHHMSAGKMHVRSRGPVQILTRQPTEGRARQGGLRFGEMERDCLIGHGVAMVIKDKLLDESDGTILYVCGDQKCGHIGMLDRKGFLRCPVCGDTGNIYPIQTSYAFKLLMDELLSMGVALRLKLEDLR
ncbi:MAG: DNA-directed RNA polymerase subunit B [Candidatus Thermoplasmatota archaeon]